MPQARSGASATQEQEQEQENDRPGKCGREPPRWCSSGANLKSGRPEFSGQSGDALLRLDVALLRSGFLIPSVLGRPQQDVAEL